MMEKNIVIWFDIIMRGREKNTTCLKPTKLNKKRKIMTQL